MTTYSAQVTRDNRHEDAAIARDIAEWQSYLQAEQKASRTREDYLRTAARLATDHMDVGRDLIDADPPADPPERAIKAFTPAHVMQTLNTFPPGSQRINRAHLSSLFRWAVLQDYIVRNPMDRVPNIKQTPQAIVPIFNTVQEDLLCSLPSPDGYLFTLLFGTALRKGEARRLRRCDISIPNERLAVHHSKYGKSRLIPLSLKVISAIEELEVLEGINGDDYLWHSRPAGGRAVSRYKPVGEGTFHRWYVNGLKRAGVEYLKPHTTRHTAATRWRREGLDIDEIQKLLGHASSATTERIYVHTTVDDIARHMRMIEAGA